jgi:hypothetical protein
VVAYWSSLFILETPMSEYRSPESKARRKQKDHERYLRHQDERQAKQREYYKANRENILKKKRTNGLKKWGSIREKL